MLPAFGSSCVYLIFASVCNYSVCVALSEAQWAKPCWTGGYDYCTAICRKAECCNDISHLGYALHTSVCRILSGMMLHGALKMTTSKQSWCRFLRSHACNSLIIIIIIIINKEKQIKIKQIILERIQQTDRQTDRQAGAIKMM